MSIPGSLLTIPDQDKNVRLRIARHVMTAYNRYAFAFTGRGKHDEMPLTQDAATLCPGLCAFALFVPTSSAALGIAFKASLMLCSHLHEQSGLTLAGSFLFLSETTVLDKPDEQSVARPKLCHGEKTSVEN